MIKTYWQQKKSQLLLQLLHQQHQLMLLLKHLLQIQIVHQLITKKRKEKKKNGMKVMKRITKKVNSNGSKDANTKKLIKQNKFKNLKNKVKEF